jgi:hypothetical protein
LVVGLGGKVYDRYIGKKDFWPAAILPHGDGMRYLLPPGGFSSASPHFASPWQLVGQSFNRQMNRDPEGNVPWVHLRFKDSNHVTNFAAG